MNITHLINRRSAIIALLISLLLHISTVIYMALEKNGLRIPFFDQKTEELIENPQEKIQKAAAEWAETKGRNGSGSPVLFRDEPDEEIMPDLTDNSMDNEATTTQDFADTQQDATANAQVPDTQTVQQESKLIQEPIKETVDATSCITEKDTPKTHISSVQKSQPTIQPQPAIAQILPNNAQKAAVIAQPAAPPAKPLVMKKKPLSLSQLTQGVMNYVKDEGQYAVSMIGKNGGIPSDEQMKYERYLQKLNWCLQNSFTINNDRFPHDSTINTSADVFLSINKDGTLNNLRITKSSGDARVDAFLIFAFHDASSEFPPVPQYLPHNPFSITYVIDLNPRRDSFNLYRR